MPNFESTNFNLFKTIFMNEISLKIPNFRTNLGFISKERHRRYCLYVADDNIFIFLYFLQTEQLFIVQKSVLIK